MPERTLHALMRLMNDQVLYFKFCPTAQHMPALDLSLALPQNLREVWALQFAVHETVLAHRVLR